MKCRQGTLLFFLEGWIVRRWLSSRVRWALFLMEGVQRSLTLMPSVPLSGTHDTIVPTKSGRESTTFKALLRQLGGQEPIDMVAFKILESRWTSIIDSICCWTLSIRMMTEAEWRAKM
ncbi:hypothetical protein F443_09313 [Phytophthora nicotianae P1569]|uniref:Uncharacterized protein n=1 Tax=Phytophthora nicotianae P1569 TaxID=1317065 RepID=V9F691_PHYNI|nr:hypothetical protein F443_09313 [Phytophthora nicotianae P1569]